LNKIKLCICNISLVFNTQTKKGKIIFELNGIEKKIAKEAFRLGSSKLPIKTDVIERVIK